MLLKKTFKENASWNIFQTEGLYLPYCTCKNISVVRFSLCQLFSRAGPFEILYQKRSSIHTDGTEAVHIANCQINCRFDEGRNAGRSVMRWQPEGGF